MTTYVDLNGYESVSTMIDNGAEGCGAVSCAGWALLKGVYVVGSMGFASVHDPIRDAYDAGKISGKQYAVGAAGAGAVAGVNIAATMMTGGTGTTATAALGSTVVARIVNAGATGAAVALADDSLKQATNVAAGLQETYNPRQGVIAAATGAAFGGGSAGLVEGAIAGRNAIATRRAATSAPGVSTQNGVIADARLTAEGAQKEIAAISPPAEQNSVQTSSKFWQNPVEINGRRVYQREDLFDPERISSWRERGKTITGTNLERMKSGRAPIGFDDLPVELHHLTQSEVNGLSNTPGAVAEVGSKFHSDNTATLHIPTGRNPNKPADRLPKYSSFRKDNFGNETEQAAVQEIPKVLLEKPGK